MSDNGFAKPEACATEESLRPRERSRQLDEALRFQRLQKTVSIPVPPQHCAPVHTGTTGFFSSFSWTVLKLPPVDEPTDWHFCCVWILCSSSPRFLKSAVFVTFSTGNSVSPPEVSALICALRWETFLSFTKSISNFNVCGNESLMIAFLTCCGDSDSSLTANQIGNVGVRSVWFHLTLLLKVKKKTT